MNWQHWDRSRWPTWMMRLRCSASRSEAQIRSPLASNVICGNPVNDLDHSLGGHRGHSETPRGPPSPLPLRRNSIAGWSQDRRARHRLSGFHIRCGPTRSRGCLSQPCPFLARRTRGADGRCRSQRVVVHRSCRAAVNGASEQTIDHQDIQLIWLILDVRHLTRSPCANGGTSAARSVLPAPSCATGLVGMRPVIPSAEICQARRSSP